MGAKKPSNKWWIPIVAAIITGVSVIIAAILPKVLPPPSPPPTPTSHSIPIINVQTAKGFDSKTGEPKDVTTQFHVGVPFYVIFQYDFSKLKNGQDPGYVHSELYRSGDNVLLYDPGAPKISGAQDGYSHQPLLYKQSVTAIVRVFWCQQQAECGDGSNTRFQAEGDITVTLN